MAKGKAQTVEQHTKLPARAQRPNVRLVRITSNLAAGSSRQIFSKDQRVSHTAIVENKRLGHALALVKAQQDLRHTTRVMTNSEKTGYRKRTRMVSAPLPVLSNALNS
jgi:hypothetical protein